MAFNSFGGFNPRSRRGRVGPEDVDVPGDSTGAYDPGYQPQPFALADPNAEPDANASPDHGRRGAGGGGGPHFGSQDDFTTHEVAGLKRAWGPVGTFAGGMGYSVQGPNGPNDWGNPQFFEKHSGKGAIDPLYLTELYRSWLPQTEPFFPKQFIKSGG